MPEEDQGLRLLRREEGLLRRSRRRRQVDLLRLNLPEAELRKNASPTGKGGGAPAAKAQVVGWPPIQSYRKTTMAANPPKTLNDELEARPGTGCQYVKVSMDGAPYLRKVALQVYGNYRELSSALEAITVRWIGPWTQYVLSYEDKDGDWMLVGDVPWDAAFGQVNGKRTLRRQEGSSLNYQLLRLRGVPAFV
ncbi:unnamed protein product [Spirodela intermedia]|uniref:Auxin-responsive protein n=1 Tax=Spirodela intermedia TaxID=51605 RepID=A0A7I8IVH7_SPIIN|nr:unnamed protein product [Spirodela intermedia]CAA6660996.1 unnamed protein product [Spirodela intermedia]